MDTEQEALQRAITSRFESLVDDVYCFEWEAVQQALARGLSFASLTDLVHCYVEEMLRLWGEGPRDVLPRYAAHDNPPDWWGNVEVGWGRNSKGGDCRCVKPRR